MLRLRRIAVLVSAQGGNQVQQFTFRPDPLDRTGGVVEDVLVRGMHPMVGRRLDLWRLRDFTLTRLPSSEDVLLFHCVAPGNEPTSGSSRWRRSASCPWSGTPPATSSRCRRPSGPCRPAWTPSAAPGPPCPAAPGST